MSCSTSSEGRPSEVESVRRSDGVAADVSAGHNVANAIAMSDSEIISEIRNVWQRFFITC